MQKSEDSSNSDHPEAQLPDTFLRSLREYANGPEIKVSETTDTFILSEAKQRLSQSDVAPVQRMARFPIRMAAGLAAAFAMFFGLKFVSQPEQQPSSLQISRTPAHLVEQGPETSLVWEERLSSVTQFYADIPHIASFDAPAVPSDKSDLPESDVHQTDQTLPQLTGNIYSM
ncbi:MAG: hypothetical protein AAF065_10405 [Verrucomicrobiota bacterium]